MRGRIAKIFLSLPFLIVVGVFGAYLAFGFFLVNPLAQRLLPWIGEQKLASRLSAQRVTFNPFTLEATVDGLQLAEMNGAPLASFGRLYLDVEGSGLFRWAWHIRDIQLDRLHGNVEARRDGRLNWSALLDKLEQNREPPGNTVPRLLIDHIRIADSRLEYTDANRAGEPFKALLAPLDIEFDGLSTLPEDRGDYLIAGKLPEQGGTLRWKGDVSLNPLASRGELGLEGVRVGQLLRAVRTPRNYEVPSGTIGAGLRYAFAMERNASGAAEPVLRIAGANLIVQNLALAPAGGGPPVLELTEARLTDANIDPARRSIAVAGVSLAGGKVTATRNAHGVLDWQTLFAPAAPTETVSPGPKQTAPPPPPWKVGIRDMRVSGWTARFADEGYVRPLLVDADGIGVTASVAGEVGATTAVEVRPVNAVVGPVRVLSGSQTVARLQRAALSGASVKLPENRLSIDALELHGATTTVELDKHHNLNWAGYLRKASGTAERAPAAKESPSSSSLDLQLARLSVQDAEIGVIDQTPGGPVRLDIVQGFITLKDLSADRGKALPLETGFALKQGGRFSASGTVVPDGPSGRLDVKLSGWSLKPFAPYVNQFARLHLNSGSATTHGALTFAPGRSGMKLGFGGGFQIDDLAIIEEESREAFLGWKKLSSTSLKVGLQPDRLHMDELVAQNLFGKFIIFEDRSTNLEGIVRSAPGDKRPKAAAASRPAPDRPPAFPLAVDRLRILGGRAEFADLSLTPQFGTRMHDLAGVVTGLSNNPGTVAQVELDGRVDEFGSARARGSIQPFRATDFTDLKLSFRNLEMTNLTPYSGKFAGRKIDSGKLSVDLEYKIKQRQLAGENKFVVNKLKLGERVDSPDAVNLPLDLALALLEDSNGVIDLDLPVSGSLDDPQFSYGRIIWKAVVNVITRVVTAPFRALGRLLGVNSEKFEAIAFDPGSSRLLPPEQQKLRTLADALARRPALALTLKPAYDPAADRLALQELAIRREAAAVAGDRLEPGEAPGPVDLNLHKIQTWLEDRYAEVAGKAEYQKLRADYKTGGIAESRLVERLGRRLKPRDDGPASAFHVELLERLTRQTKIDDKVLVNLAQTRGQAIRDTLLKLGLDPARVAVAAPVTQAARDKVVASGLELRAGERPAAPRVPAAPAP